MIKLPYKKYVTSQSLLNCVPYVLTCHRALHAYVLTCQRALRAYVLTCFTCLLANMSCVLKCSNPNVLMCLRAFCTYVLTCFACLLVNGSCVLKCSNANVLMWLRANLLTCECAYVRTCLHANVPRVPCLTCQHSLPD